MNSNELEKMVNEKLQLFDNLKPLSVSTHWEEGLYEQLEKNDFTEKLVSRNYSLLTWFVISINLGILAFLLKNDSVIQKNKVAQYTIISNELLIPTPH